MRHPYSYRAVKAGMIEKKLYESISRTGIYSAVTLRYPMKDKRIRSALIRKFAVCGWRISFVNGGRKIEVG